MDGSICRYGARAKVRDACLCAGGSLLGGGAVAAVGWGGDLEPFLAAAGGVLLASMFTVIRWRWRRWVGADESGLFAGNADGDPVERLGWEEIEEIVLYRGGGFEARGGGATVRAGIDLEGLLPFRDVLLRRRAPSLYRKLRRRFHTGEALEFFGRRTPVAALAHGLAFFLFLWVPLSAPFWWLGKGWGLGVVGILGLGTLARESLACARVTLDGRGIALRTLRTRCFDWEDVESARLLEAGHLAFQPRGGGPILLSPEMSNFLILQELILERVPAR